MVVWTHAIRSPFEPHRRDSSAVPYRFGMTVGDLIPSGMDVEGLCSYQNGAVTSRDCLVSDGDHLSYWKRPQEPLALASAAFISSVTGPLSVGAAQFIAGTIVYGGLAGSIFLASKFLGSLAPEIERGSQQSPTYSFGGIQNARTEGSPIHIPYGVMRVGGMVINEFTTNTTSPARSVYHVLICLGEGEIEAIGDKAFVNETEPFRSDGSGAGTLPEGLQINGNPAENFDGIEAWIRLGTLDQTVIPGYTDTKTQFSVGLDLDQTEIAGAATSAIITEDNFYGQGSLTLSEVDAIWDEYGESYSFVSSYDAFDTVFQFPGGLWKSSTTTGNISGRSIDLVCRYIELDSGGSPIASGGPEGDGYVRLPPVNVTEKITSAFFSQPRKFEFYDPQTYSHAALAEAASFDGTNDYAQNTSPTIPSSWINASANIPAFSISGWFKYDAARLGNRNVVELATMNGSDVEGGFRFGFQDKTFGFPGSQTFHIPVVEFGIGPGLGGSFDFYEDFENPSGTPSFQPQAGEWHHIAVTYSQNYQGGSADRFRIYANGVQIQGKTVNSNVKGLSSGYQFLLGATIQNKTGTGASWKFAGDIDELRVTETEMTAAEVLDDYNTGAGRYGPIGGEVFAYHFDTDFTTYETSLYINDLTNINGATITSGGGGVVRSPLTTPNTKKKGRFKVEWLRAVEDSTNASLRDDVTWASIIGIDDQAFSHPGRALLALKVEASEQLNTSAPTITARISGRKVPVWDGESTSTPAMPETFSANPAWVALDFVTNDFYGLGAHYTVGDIDLDSLKAWADFSGGMLYDKLGTFTAVTDWTDMRYQFIADENGQRRGRIEVYFTSAAMAKVRQRYRPNGFANSGIFSDGDYLALDGVNVVTESVDTPAENTLFEELPTRPGAWPILLMSNTSDVVTLDVLLPADPWPDGTLLSASVGGLANVTGTVEGREQRFQFNGVLDQPRSGWDGLLAIATAGRATVIREGSGLRFKFEQPRSAVDLVNWASIIEGSFEVDFAGKSQRPNALTVDYLDAKQNWERVSARAEDETVQNSSSFTGYRTQVQFLEGCTSRRQAMAAATFQINLYSRIIRSGRFRTGPDSIPYDVGDVVLLSHEVTQWGVGGRVRELSSGASEIILDQDVTLASGKVYEVTLRHSVSGIYETVGIDQTVHVPPTTVTAGDPITMSSAFSDVPAIGDLYVYCAQGEGMLVQITGWSRNQRLEHSIEWVEYDSTVYTDDTYEEILSADAASTPAQNSNLVPTNVQELEVSQATARVPGGNAHKLTVSWEPGASDAPVSRFGVYVRRGSGREPFELMAEADGSARSTSFEVEGAENLEHVVVAVQPISDTGTRFRPERCAKLALLLDVFGLSPNPPTGLTFNMDGERAIYRWTNGENADACTTILRRGGWVLGQPIASLPPGINERQTTNWAGGRADANGDQAPTIVARHRSGAGGMSSALRLEGVNPNVPDTSTLNNFEREVEEWQDHDFEPTDIPAPILTDLGVGTDWRGRKFLGFVGSSLTASYTTSIGGDSLANAVIRARDCLVEFFVEGIQSDPTPLSNWPPLGSAKMGSWSLEGHTNPVDGQSCTLKVMIELDDSGDWVEYSPGIYKLATVKFRVDLTRPSSDWTVRLYRIHQRVRRIPFRYQNENAAQLRSMGNLYNR